MLIPSLILWIAHHLDLHSFPTRRSSDLQLCGVLARAFRPAVVLEEEAEPPRSASVAAVAVRTETAMRTCGGRPPFDQAFVDRKSTRLNSSHEWISYAVFCLKKKKKQIIT